jgi:hypothetical protein
MCAKHNQAMAEPKYTKNVPTDKPQRACMEFGVLSQKAGALVRKAGKFAWRAGKCTSEAGKFGELASH